MRTSDTDKNKLRTIPRPYHNASDSPMQGEFTLPYYGRRAADKEAEHKRKQSEALNRLILSKEEELDDLKAWGVFMLVVIALLSALIVSCYYSLESAHAMATSSTNTPTVTKPDTHSHLESEYLPDNLISTDMVAYMLNPKLGHGVTFEEGDME